MSAFAHLGLDTRAALQSLGAETAAPGGPTIGAAAMITAAETIAAALRAKGSATDEPVVLFIANEPPDLAGFLGIWLAGCVAAPIHVSTPAAAADALVTRLGSRFAVRAGAVSAIGDAAPPRRRLLKDAALIVFTSGSTGQPKGVVVGHTGLSWKLGALSRLLNFTRDDVVAVPLQLTFIFGNKENHHTQQTKTRQLLTPKLAQDPQPLADAT